MSGGGGFRIQETRGRNKQTISATPRLCARDAFFFCSRATAWRAGAAPWERGRLALRSRFGEEWVPAASVAASLRDALWRRVQRDGYTER